MNIKVYRYYGSKNLKYEIENVCLPIISDLKLNEELDTCSFDIIDVNYKRRIPKNTRIEIDIDGRINQFVVIYDDVKVKRQGTNKKYNHSVALVESTSLLGQIQLSNICFSKNVKNLESSKIENILDRLIKIVNNEHNKNFKLDNETLDIIVKKDFGNVEFFFNNLNFLECLREIGAKINAIPRLKNYDTITFDFLNKPAINNINIWDDTKYINADDNYFQLPDTNYRNLISFGSNIVSEENDEGNLTFPYPKGASSVVCLKNQSIRISNDSAIFYLGGQKIYQIINFQLAQLELNPSSPDYGKTKGFRDITSHIYTKEQYDILPDTEEGKGQALIYNQYGTYIYGLSNQPIAGFVPPYPALLNIIKKYPEFESQDFNDYVFRCTFRTVFDNSIKVERTNNDSFNYEDDLLINQPVNQLGSNNYSNYLTAKINKLGNLEISKTYIFKDINDLPKLGDVVKSNNYFVNEIVYQANKSTIVANIKITKDFNKISEFISVNSRKRPFPIPVDNFISERHVNNVSYIRLSHSPSILNNSNRFVSDLFMKYLFSSFSKPLDILEGEDELVKCNCAYFEMYEFNDGSSGNIFKSILPVNSYVGTCNSLCYSFKMRDNISFGDYNTRPATSKSNLSTLKCSNSGTSGYSTVTLLNEIDQPNIVLGVGEYDLSRYQQPFYNGDISKRPYIYSNGQGIFRKFCLLKDIREIFNVTQQITFITDDSDIFFRKEFLNKNRSVNDEKLLVGQIPKLYYLKGRKLSEYEEKVPNDAIKAKDFTEDSIPKCKLLENGIEELYFYTDAIDCDCWFLTDNNNNILLGANEPLRNYNVIYAIQENERSNNVDPYNIVSMTIRYANADDTIEMRTKIKNIDNDFYTKIEHSNGISMLPNENTTIISDFNSSIETLSNVFVSSKNIEEINFENSSINNGTKILDFKISYDGIEKLIFTNYNNKLFNFKTLDLTNATNRLKYLDVSGMDTLNEIIINNNNLQYINLTDSGIIKDENINNLIKFLDNLNDDKIYEKTIVCYNASPDLQELINTYLQDWKKIY